ncbi:tetratricopeptide repeat protein [Prevotella communis]|uniref:Sel1 repeat-containing protein n=1 Tax=Prevotella communis TaxID=2913614 RepID=A0A1H0FTV4_9BACT|nr:tetratricopeptide repeat protein [Prevotella communis]SDN98077.1 Sel1 repeat-containing protein [Prevotella communis]
MKRLIYLCILLMCSISISAQSADKLYDEGKKLYDQEQYKEAVPKLQAAADKGHKKAQYRLGRCYDKGYGVKENDQKAFELYQKSAKQDYAKAMFQLGKCYMKGKGVTANQEEARKWIKRAIGDEKHGDEILKDLRKAKADGEEATRILTLIGKNK